LKLCRNRKPSPVRSKARICPTRHPWRRPPISSPSIRASNLAASPCETLSR
jgi:hypothetical protein